MPRAAPDVVTVLAAILDALDRLDRRLDTLGDHVKAARKGIDRLSLPEGHDAHPEFAETAPLWLLERYQDGKARGVYFPSNCATAAGAMIPTKRLGDAMRFTTLADAERFIACGHDAMSCDLLPTEAPGPHYQGDVRDILGDGWDLMVGHPPCTDLAVSGSRWFAIKGKARQDAALDFVRLLMTAPIERIAIENPVSVISSRIRPPDQIIQPWMFGHGETKATCLWLKNLPPLRPTCIVEGREQRVHRLPPSPDRWKLRSATYAGVAAAMAEQWGSLEPGRGVQAELFGACA